MTLRTLLRILTLLLLLCLGGWLAVDAVTFRLMAPDEGSDMARGCYTTPELWLGHKTPSDTFRLTQLIVGGVGLLSGLGGLTAMGVRGLRRRRRAGR